MQLEWAKKESVCLRNDQSKLCQTLDQRPLERKILELSESGRSWHQIEGVITIFPMMFILSKMEMGCESYDSLNFR